VNSRELGTTGLKLSTLSFGAAGIGNLYREVSREDAIATLEAAWEAGIRYFDTAPHYGHGLSERRLGDFLRDKPEGSYVLSSKVGRLLKPVRESDVPEHGFVRLAVMGGLISGYNYGSYGFGHDHSIGPVAAPIVIVTYKRVGMNFILVPPIPSDNLPFTIGFQLKLGF